MEEQRRLLVAELIPIENELRTIKEKLREAKKLAHNTKNKEARAAVDALVSYRASLTVKKKELDVKLRDLAPKELPQPPSHYYWFYVAATEYLPKSVVKAIESEAHRQLITKVTK
jgi:hypothetical protein